MRNSKRKYSSPLVSIIMNCLNGEKYLKSSIKSIFNQSYRNWELIFFDNNSKDRSQRIIKDIKDRRIRYFKSKKVLSLYKARNLAISKASGKYISFLDVDDWWTRDKLKKQVDTIEKNKDFNLVYSNLFIHNNKTKKNYIYIKKPFQNGFITQNLLNDYKLPILTVLIKREIFKIKKFNKIYNIIGDFDFFINLSLKEKFFYIHKPLAYYRKHETNYSKKINIYVKELDNWQKINLNKYKNLNFSLKRFKYWFYKLKIKKLVGWGL